MSDLKATDEFQVTISTKNIQSQSNKEQNLFSLAVEMSLDAIIIGELNGIITYVNNAALELRGADDKKELIGKQLLEFVSEKDQNRAWTLSQNSLKTGKSFLDQFKIKRKDGSEIDVEITASIITKDNQPIGFIDIIRSITERKKTEKMLKKQAELIDLSPSAIIVTDEQRVINFWNKGAERLYGFTKDEALGQKINILLKAIYPKPIEEITSYLKDGKQWIAEVTHYSKDNKEMNVQTDWAAFKDRNGEIIEILESNTDITDYKKAEQAVLKIAEERYLKAERMAAIGSIAGMVGHDLRNPLAAIKGAVYVLRKKQASFIGDSGVEMLNTIDQAVNYSDNIISDLLDYSREVHLELEEISTKSLINYIILSLSIPKNIKIFERTGDYQIWADSNKLQRVFVNLIKNAFDAMQNGGQLEITTVYNNDTLDFIFSDSGYGMSEAVLQNIFTPLFTTKAKGMGLGLAICKRLVEAHEGKIAVESVINKGTKFIVSLPVKPKSVSYKASATF